MRTSIAGHASPVSRAASDYLPGDIVSWGLGRRILHISVVSAGRASTGVPLIVHNIDAGAREEDILVRYAIIGHYRRQTAGRRRLSAPSRHGPFDSR